LSEHFGAMLLELRPEALLLVYRAMEVIGIESFETIKFFRSVVEARGSQLALARQYGHVVQAYNIECIIAGKESDNIQPLVEWCRNRGVLGDLFAGAKGAYRRCLLRVATIPFRAEAVRKAVRESIAYDDSGIGEIIDHVGSSGWVEDYYHQAYSLVDRIKTMPTGELADSLRLSTLSVADRFWGTWRNDNELIEFPATRALWRINEDLQSKSKEVVPGVGWTDIDLLEYAHRKYRVSLIDWTVEKCEWLADRPPAPKDISPLREGGIHFRIDKDSYLYSVETSPEWDLSTGLNSGS